MYLFSPKSVLLAAISSSLRFNENDLIEWLLPNFFHMIFYCFTKKLLWLEAQTQSEFLRKLTM